MKRAFDIVVSAAALVIVLPVLVLLTIGTILALRCNPFFAQERVGRDGSRFRIVKLRTLPPSTPANADKHVIAGYHTPAFCRLLRSLHVDELPQLFLVLTGKMSLVGPRPEMPILQQGYDLTFAEIRQQVRPGCTGLWQVSVACLGLIPENPQYDEFYVANGTVRLDLWVLLRTLRGMVPGLSRPLKDLDEVPAWTLRTGHDVRWQPAPRVIDLTPEPAELA